MKAIKRILDQIDESDKLLQECLQKHEKLMTEGKANEQEIQRHIAEKGRLSKLLYVEAKAECNK